jgi:hypothetical protein
MHARHNNLKQTALTRIKVDHCSASGSDLQAIILRRPKQFARRASLPEAPPTAEDYTKRACRGSTTPPILKHWRERRALALVKSVAEIAAENGEQMEMFRRDGGSIPAP